MAHEEIKRAAGHVSALKRVGAEKAAENLYANLIAIGADKRELDEAIAQS